MSKIDYLVYDVGYYSRLYDTETNTFKNLGCSDNCTLLDLTKDFSDYAELQCLAIISYNKPMYVNEKCPKGLLNILKKNDVSGIVFQLWNPEKQKREPIDYSIKRSICEMIQELEHCACIGSIYNENIIVAKNGNVILEIQDDTESG